MDRVFTAAELQEQNGKEGGPMLIAYDGHVYDVSASKLWRGGVHVRQHQAGNDLTESILMAPHDESVFDREHIQLIGVLAPPEGAPAQPAEAVEAPAEAEAPAGPVVAPEAVPPAVLEGRIRAHTTRPEAPRREWQPAAQPGFTISREWAVEFFFDLHPHPVSVHFPIAYTAGLGILTVLDLITGDPTIRTGALVLLWMGFLTLPIAMAMGAISWWRNYALTLTTYFKLKVILSFVLLVVLGATVWLRVAEPAGAVTAVPALIAYIFLVLIAVILVAALGWIGDRIAFPRVRKPASGS